MSAIENGPADGDFVIESEIVSDIAPERVFVRKLSLPTQAVRQARAAVELQLDRLSPIPRALAQFDLVPLGMDTIGTKYAVGIVTRQTLRDAAHNRPDLAVLRAVVELDGAPVAFGFVNEVYRDARRAKWMAVAPNLVLILSSVCILLAGIDHRLTREVTASDERIATLRRDLVERRRADEQQQSAWSSWSSGQSDQIARQGRCALAWLGTWSSRLPPLNRLELGPSGVKLTFVRPVSAAIRGATGAGAGFTWDPSTLTMGRNACP